MSTLSALCARILTLHPSVPHLRPTRSAVGHRVRTDRVHADRNGACRAGGAAGVLPVRRVLSQMLVIVVSLLGLSAELALAQCPPFPPCQDDPPIITITPSGGEFTSSTRQVTIAWSDDFGLNGGTRVIRHNGNTVTGAFSYTPWGNQSASSGGTITLTQGSNTLEAEIYDSNGQRTITSATYVYNPPPPPAAHAQPTISFAPHNPGVSLPSPFDGRAGYATPAYTSLDAPRSVQLVYNSSRAQPIGFLQLDVIDNSTTQVSRLELRVTGPAPGNGFVTFTNDSTRIFYLGKNGKNRIAAQWSADELATGAYTYTVNVTTHFVDGQFAQSTATTRVIIVKEATSPFGAGWSVPGLQKLHFQADGILVTNGDGSAVFFESAGGGAYAQPLGEFSTLKYIAASETYHRLSPDSSKAVFSSTGELQYVVDRFGRSTNFGYSAGLLTTVTDPVNKQMVLSYNGNGKIATITDPANRTTTMTVNGAGDLINIVGPDNVSAFTGTYDSDHRLRTRTDRRSKTWGYAYDFAGKVSADTLPAVMVSGNMVRPVVGYVAWERAALASDCYCDLPFSHPDSLRARVIDANGNVTKLAFDRFYGETLIQRPHAHTDSIYRTIHGLPERVVDPYGAATTYGWDVNGNMESMQQPQTSQSISITFDPIWKTDPAVVSVGNSDTYYEYGTTGQLLHTWINLDSTIYTYDPKWRVATIRDPQGHTTTYAYNPSGWENVASTTFPAGAGGTRTTSFGYDAYGRQNSVTTPAGTSSSVFDIMNRQLQNTDATNKTTVFEYDGDLVSKVRDAADKEYQFQHNALGWIESQVDPNDRSMSFRYDKAGNMVGATNRRSQEISLVPDSLGRIKSRTADGAITTFAYGPPSARWVAASNTESTDTIFSDEQGRVKSEVAVIGGRRYELKSGYLPEGPRDTLKLTAPTWSRTVRYQYNNALQLDTLSQLVGGVNKKTSIQYNQDGLPWRIKLPTSSVRNQDIYYTPGHQTSAIDFVGTGLGVAYNYDGMDRVWRRTTGDSIREFYYNQRKELTRFWDFRTAQQLVCPEPDSPPEDCYWQEFLTFLGGRDYDYDAVGNRTDSGATLQPSSNRYQTFSGYTFEYDNDGNVTRKYKTGFDQSYSWNTLGQLTRVTTNGVPVDYGYNGFGERIRRSGSTSSRYVYDGDDLALEVDQSGNKVREFTYYPGVDRPHSMFDASGAVSYFQMDFPGNVTGVLNASGNVVGQYRYSPWGEAEMVSGSVSNPLRYMGRELDDQTGMYYVRNRWYDPEIGRFISEDPVGLEGGINTHAYVGNDPVNNRDPSGLGWICWDESKLTPVPNPGGIEGVEISWVTRCEYFHGGSRGHMAGGPGPSSAGGVGSGRGGGAGAGPGPTTDPSEGRPLSPCEVNALEPYSSVVDMNAARVHDGHVPWYLIFSPKMVAITRGNHIYRRSGNTSSTRLGVALLGHELVHVGQYRQGMTAGWYLLEGLVNNYYDIPYEVPAYALQRVIRNDANVTGCF
jgi:RHS repeat-associated protein